MENDKRILSLALNALYSERQKIDSEIATIEKKLGSKPDNGHFQLEVADKPGRRMSAAGRKAISDAQKKRWAASRRGGIARKRTA